MYTVDVRRVTSINRFDTLVYLQVVSLCWAHGLYDAILYIYNQGMADYTTPLEELLSLLAAALSTGKQLTGQS